MNIIIGADLVPTSSNAQYFKNADVNHLLGSDLSRILDNADYRIFNLETPLTDNRQPILKHGPDLIAPKDSINGIKSIKVDLFTLANNHILDQGEQGFFDTVKLLDENKIAYVGAGENSDKASDTFIFQCDGKKIGVYACAEHEFSIATDSTCGANPYDPLVSFDAVSDLKNKCDYLIVLYHGGKEHYRYPSPNLQRVCRKFADKGADLIICQHSHCIGCMEEYNTSTIVYGQGNFLFDKKDNEYWSTSLLVNIKDNFEIDYIPLIKAGDAVRVADTESAKNILCDFALRSDQIKQDGFIEKEYAALSKREIDAHLFQMSAIKRGFLYKVINKLSGHRFEKWLLCRLYRKNKILYIQNMVKCETHIELIANGLSGKLK